MEFLLKRKQNHLKNVFKEFYIFDVFITFSKNKKNF